MHKTSFLADIGFRNYCQSYYGIFFYTHTDQSLEEVLAKCQAVLDSFQAMDDVTWESRMENLNENWEASRSSIFEAILLSQNPSVELCDICHKAPCLLRCDECSGRRMCPKCDANIHKEHLFHDREALINSFFRHIPPTFIMNEDGKLEQTSKLTIFHVNLLILHHHKLPQCVNSAGTEFISNSPVCSLKFLPDTISLFLNL